MIFISSYLLLVSSQPLRAGLCLCKEEIRSTTTSVNLSLICNTLRSSSFSSRTGIVLLKWQIFVLANWHTKSLWITSRFMFPTTNPLRGVWQQQWHDRKDNSHRAFFWAWGYFLPISCFVEYQTWTMGRSWIATEWVSCAWLPRRLGVFTLVCLDSCLWSSQLSYLLARWQHASGKTTPSRSSHHLDHSFLPLHLLQLLGTSNIHLGMHALNCLGELKEQPNSEYKTSFQIIIIPVEPEELPSLPKRLFRGSGKGKEWPLKPRLNPAVEIFIFECLHAFGVLSLGHLQWAWS